MDVLRSGQELGRGGWRHRRDHRFLRILWTRNAAPGRPAAADADARREELPGVHSAGRGRNYSAVEFSSGNHGRADGGVDRYRKHRGAETFERFADYRLQIPGISDPGGAAEGRSEFYCGAGGDDRGGGLPASQDALHRVHRIEGSGAAHPGGGGQASTGADVDQAHHAGDGRQGRDHRGR